MFNYRLSVYHPNGTIERRTVQQPSELAMGERQHRIGIFDLGSPSERSPLPRFKQAGPGAEVKAGLFPAPQRLIPPRAHAGREPVVALDDVHGVTYAGFGGGHAGLAAPSAHFRVPYHWIVAP